MVKSTKRKAYLAGAALNEIHADPFEFSHKSNADKTQAKMPVL